METDSPGFRHGRTLEKIGRKSQDTVELFFDSVLVPASNVIGRENGGFDHLVRLLERERLGAAIRAFCAAEWSCRWTIDYVRERQVFGRPIADFQNTQFELAELWSQIVVLRSFLDDCLERLMARKLSPEDAAIAKLRASELEGVVTDRCLQFFGGWGYMWEMPIARAYADARVSRISAGSNHILKMIIGRKLLRG